VTPSNGDAILRGFTSRRVVNGLIVGAAAITVVSLVVDVLQRFVDPIGLTSLYLFAIFPVAIGWGFLAAGIVTVASFLTFAFFFGEPVHSFQIADRETAASLTIALASAYVVSELARRAHERALEAQTRADEAEAMQGELQILAAEQSALRRVATLVAQREPTVKVLEAVTREVGLRCDAGLARMERFEPDGTITAIAAWSRSDDVQLASARASSWRARASPGRCGKPENRRVWTVSRAPLDRSLARLRHSASSPPSAVRSWSPAGRGE
jgi:K+-sensing histidine kinase KdpD